MKKSVLAVLVGCVVCSMATGCGSSVNAEPSNIVYTDAATTSSVIVPMETGVSTEAAQVENDLFETTALNLNNLKNVTIFASADDEDAEDEFTLPVYAGAEKKLNEFSYAYTYKYEGCEYKVEVSDNLKKNVSQKNCEWMTSYSEVASYMDGKKCSMDYTTVDCLINDQFEMVCIRIENPEYGKNQTQLEDRYYIKDNTTGCLDMIVVSVVRDTKVYGQGTMPITKNYMDSIKNSIYAEFSR